MKMYEKPIVEVISIMSEESIMDGEAGLGPSGVQGGVGDLP